MKFTKVLFAVFFALFMGNAVGQTSADHAVQIGVSVQQNPPKILLQWPGDPVSTGYQIFRKAPDANSWGSVLANLPGDADSFEDADVQTGTVYEYKIYKTAPAPGYAFGYAYAGIEVPPIHANGRILLLIDSLFMDTNADELNRYRHDLVSDGWDVHELFVSRNNSALNIKSMILEQVNLIQEPLNALMLIGHIPVPYSGNIYPDGHPDHKGAWPADVYYADLNGTWSDFSVNETSASRPENHNVPGDGKFDPSFLSSDVELQIGRIDFYNMPGSGKTEPELLKNYLDHNHAYRKKEVNFQLRALVDDNFGAFNSEAFAANAYKNFAPMVGAANITEADLMTTLSTDDYLWAYGCGGGWYQGASGIGNAAEVMGQEMNTAFAMLFGSYFGDWDTEDNFLRAPLCAQVPALASMWAGRPHWALHSMGLGRNIGLGTLASQNNVQLYHYNMFARSVHIALMGDLTLRQYVLAPPANLTFSQTADGYGINLHWNSSADAEGGYYVYRSDSEWEGFTLISGLVTGNSFTDTEGETGLKYYLVKATRLETTPSGSFHNLSEGICASAQVVYAPESVDHIFRNESGFRIYPNPTQGQVQVHCPDCSTFPGQISVYDLSGHAVLSVGLSAPRQTLDVGNLAPGVYAMTLSSGSRFGTRQLVIIP